MRLQILLLIVGFALLYYGAEWLVKGSTNLARSFGVTPIVIGLTVVAFGTDCRHYIRFPPPTCNTCPVIHPA